jgi:hypothetical protein
MSAEALNATRLRHDQLEAWDRSAVDPLERRRVYQARRGLARVGEYLAMKMLLDEHDIRCRSSRQTFDLPCVRDEMARLGLWLPPVPGIDDALIEVGEVHEVEFDDEAIDADVASDEEPAA